MSKKSTARIDQIRINSEVQRRVEAEVHASLLEQRVTALNAQIAAQTAAPAPVAPAAPPPPPPPSARETYARMKAENPYLAAQWLLDPSNQAAFAESFQVERAGK